LFEFWTCLGWAISTSKAEENRLPGIFLSHSSVDKRFVSKIAVDLAARGIPVWFDSWELEAADKLYDRIFDGIDKSTLLILALSEHTVNSKWIGRELNAALAKEDRLNRKVIIPIKVGVCDTPVSLSDRLYIDFTSDYLSKLERLESVVRNNVQSFDDIPLDRQIVPLVFTRLLYLERTLLQKRFNGLVSFLTEGKRITTRQLLAAPDAKLDEVREEVVRSVETYASSNDYDPDVEHELHNIYDKIKRVEAALLSGVADIANGLFSTRDSANFAETSHWYARLIRNELIAALHAGWYISHSSEFPIGAGFQASPTGSDFNAARFFGVKRVILCDIFREGSKDYFKVWVDRDSELGRWFEANPFIPDLFGAYWTPELAYKYVFPQIVAGAHLYRSTRRAVEWDLTGWKIGLA
jgi:hypothetical protein